METIQASLEALYKQFIERVAAGEYDQAEALELMKLCAALQQAVATIALAWARQEASPSRAA